MTRHKSRVARRSRHRARRGTRKQSGGWTFGPKPADAAPGAPPVAEPAAAPADAAADADASPGDKNSWWHSILGFFKGNNNGTPPGQVGGRKTRHRRRRSPRRHRK